MQTVHKTQKGSEGSEDEKENRKFLVARRARYHITEPLSLSDQIAFDQFVLAVERNFLLHLTTGLNMVVVGFAMFRFFSQNPNDLYRVIGGAAFFIAALIIAKGTLDFLTMRKDLASIGTRIREARESDSP
jgi:putative membrane protein